MREYKIARAVVVAKKGLKGFRKLDKLSAITTVVDCGIKRVNNIFQAIKVLMEEKMPVRFSNSEKWTKKHAIQKIKNVVFKYVLSTEIAQDGYVSIILIGNKNRYLLETDSNMSFVRLRVVKTSASSTSKINRQVVPKSKPIEVSFYEINQHPSLVNEALIIPISSRIDKGRLVAV